MAVEAGTEILTWIEKLMENMVLAPFRSRGHGTKRFRERAHRTVSTAVHGSIGPALRVYTPLGWPSVASAQVPTVPSGFPQVDRDSCGTGVRIPASG